jgi:hypothetical protein
MTGRITPHTSTFAKWRVEEVLLRSVFNLTFVASLQVEVPNPPNFEPIPATI